MDFQTLLYKAQMNTAKKNENIKYFKAELDPPKKEENKVFQMSNSVKKFLANREEKHKQKQLEEENRNYELLSSHSQDQRSLKPVQSILNDTKSENKLDTEDKKDDIVFFTMAGNKQPDEDDSEYVLNNGMDISDKIVDKYVNIPYDSKNIKTANRQSHVNVGAKDKRKAALLKEKKKKLLPKKRKTKPTAEENGDDHNYMDSKQQKKKFKTEFYTKNPKKQSAQPLSLNVQGSHEVSENKHHTSIGIEKPKRNKSFLLMNKYEREILLKEQKIEAILQQYCCKQQQQLKGTIESSTGKLKEDKFLSKSNAIPKFERCVPKSSRSLSSNKLSPKSKNVILSDEQSSRQILCEKYVTHSKEEKCIFSSLNIERYVPKGNSSSPPVPYTPGPISIKEISPRHFSEISRNIEDSQDECIFRMYFLNLQKEICCNTIAGIEKELADIKRELKMIKETKQS